MSTAHPTASQSATSHVLPEHEDNPDTFHIFVLVKTTRHWLDYRPIGGARSLTSAFGLC